MMSHVKESNDDDAVVSPADVEEPGSSITITEAENRVVDAVQETPDVELRSGTHVNDRSYSEDLRPSHNEIQLSNWKHKSSHPLQNVITPLDSGIQTKSKSRNSLAFLTFLSQIEPKNIKKALKDADWITAMQDELHQFERNSMWHLVPRPADRTVIGTRWVFINKLDEFGNTTRNKARLVVQGYNQEEGIDYDETFSPVARMEDIKILIAFASHMEFKLFQMDVKSAFLNGFLKEEVCVKQPSSFECHEHPEHIFKLDKALYGLKQAPRAWYERLSKFLL
ncbi:uncharacterized mitochondrial protein AtMg00820-like [Nicotiana tomentosiformis]|uniref:uncharacterized mitochondrial protein AtMg00820-like n=1 Tax=Nicotiana tomentosiformis TaxID=4098 RepID=UPI00388CE4F6